MDTARCVRCEHSHLRMPPPASLRPPGCTCHARGTVDAAHRAMDCPSPAQQQGKMCHGRPYFGCFHTSPNSARNQKRRASAGDIIIIRGLLSCARARRALACTPPLGSFLSWCCSCLFFFCCCCCRCLFRIRARPQVRCAAGRRSVRPGRGRARARPAAARDGGGGGPRPRGRRIIDRTGAVPSASRCAARARERERERERRCARRAAADSPRPL